MQFLREKIELIQSSSGSVKNSYIDKITIPMIQRDYAQGRKSHISDDINITGKKFIEEIFSVLDNENENFHEKVYSAFKDIVKTYKDRTVIIDASKPLEEVIEATYKVIKTKLDGLR